MKSKDQILLEEAYQSVREASGAYNGNRLASDAKHFNKAEGPQGLSGPNDYDFLKHKTKNVSPEAEAFKIAAASNNPEQQAAAEEGIRGKYVTVYRAVMSQNFANKSDLSDEEINAGERLHSTSSETGRDVVAAGTVKHINWGSSDRLTELVLDTDKGEQTVPFGLRNRLEVRENPVRPTQPSPSHYKRWSGMK